MTDGHRNGSPVTYREFDDYRSAHGESHGSMNKRVDRHAHRIDDLERKWDRYAGPVSVLLVILTVTATISSIYAVWAA